MKVSGKVPGREVKLKSGEVKLLSPPSNKRQLREALTDSGSFSTDRTVGILSALLRAVAAAHSQGIMHRDMKLDNILIHFPDRPNNRPIDLHTVDLENERFVIKIGDLGYAREFKNEGDGSSAAAWFATSAIRSSERYGDCLC